MRIEQCPLLLLGVGRQVPYVASIIASDVPIRRESANRLTPDASDHVACVWRMS